MSKDQSKRKPNDDRSDSKNPNNDANKASKDNRRNQLKLDHRASKPEKK